jgi:hypothetical protein
VLLEHTLIADVGVELLADRQQHKIVVQFEVIIGLIQQRGDHLDQRHLSNPVGSDEVEDESILGDQ